MAIFDHDGKMKAARQHRQDQEHFDYQLHINDLYG